MNDLPMSPPKTAMDWTGVDPGDLVQPRPEGLEFVFNPRRSQILRSEWASIGEW
jgi:hypothetical protein